MVRRARAPLKYRSKNLRLTDRFVDETHSTCIFCFDDLDSSTVYRRLPCRHFFHKPCVDDWMSRHDASCPLCRETFYHLKKVQAEPPVSGDVRVVVVGSQLGTARGRRRRRRSTSSDGFDTLKRWLLNKIK